jgi:hypothetical protein
MLPFWMVFLTILDISLPWRKRFATLYWKKRYVAIPRHVVFQQRSCVLVYISWIGVEVDNEGDGNYSELK